MHRGASYMHGMGAKARLSEFYSAASALLAEAQRSALGPRGLQLKLNELLFFL